MSETTAKATPEVILRQRLMDSCVPKSELEWFAKREIESLTAALTQSQADLAEAKTIVEAAKQYVKAGSGGKIDSYIEWCALKRAVEESTHE